MGPGSIQTGSLRRLILSSKKTVSDLPELHRAFESDDLQKAYDLLEGLQTSSYFLGLTGLSTPAHDLMCLLNPRHPLSFRDDYPVNEAVYKPPVVKIEYELLRLLDIIRNNETATEEETVPDGEPAAEDPTFTGFCKLTNIFNTIDCFCVRCVIYCIRKG